MSPENEQMMRRDIDEIKRFISSMRIAAQYDPQVVSSILKIVADELAPESSEVVTDYDQAVDENGVGTYNVPKQFDGFREIDGVLIGYYNKI